MMEKISFTPTEKKTMRIALFSVLGISLLMIGGLIISSSYKGYDITADVNENSQTEEVEPVEEPTETDLPTEPAEEQTPDSEIVVEPEQEQEIIPEPKPEAAPVQEAENLWLSMNGINSPIEFLNSDAYSNDLSNPMYAIQPGWGGSTDSYLRIKVNEPLTDASVNRLGINILNFIGPSYRNISGIIFTDANGYDYNFFRSQAPGADL